MSKSGDAIAALANQWETCKTRFPGDSDFTPHGFPGIDYSSVDRILDNLARTIAALDDRDAWGSPELAVADIGMAGRLSDLHSTLGTALSNSVQWLLTGGAFLQKLSDAQSFLTGLAVRRFSIARELAKFLAAEGEVGIERVLAAQEAAAVVLATQTEVAQDVESITAAKTTVLLHQEAAVAAKAAIDTTLTAIEAASNAAEQAKQSASKTQAEIVQLKTDAITRENGLAKRVAELDASAAAAKKLADDAIESVAKALRDLRSQGLAHSFQTQSTSLNEEKRTWMIAFGGAIAVLAAISIVLVVELPDFRYQTLIVAALRRLATAAPFIWLGWYAAKQISRVSKAQEDYAYKAASALAFQAYKEEVSGDPNLQAKLLDLAITTFGENPVRLQDHSKPEAVSPLEDILSKAKPDKLVELLVAAIVKSSNK